MEETTKRLAFYKHYKSGKTVFYATFDPISKIFQLVGSSYKSFIHNRKLHSIVKADYRIAENYGVESFQFYDTDTKILWVMDMKTFLENREELSDISVGAQWGIEPKYWQSTIDGLPVTLKQDMVKRDVYNKKASYK